MPDASRVSRASLAKQRHLGTSRQKSAEEDQPKTVDDKKKPRKKDEKKTKQKKKKKRRKSKEKEKKKKTRAKKEKKEKEIKRNKKKKKAKLLPLRRSQGKNPTLNDPPRHCVALCRSHCYTNLSPNLSLTHPYY
ncbi:uncharacterized protein ARB_01111 [Trichophyton benhamiae CBS 112371]|uniref:Uncharacterized protein n=1 Tax=Arthroderma benhamiae (strain ATCC MYA-4681 / CBS 112371) TaxID=663331 RepID=D4AY42_ARTBC|nr:uncharacterized protein ARB_01111 [Trichophyton benhamiae CBS 112371]EFE31858.1 hypothetical protein ARB_01111 [Trichophyton benhamiae CBS 112371]